MIKSFGCCLAVAIAELAVGGTSALAQDVAAPPAAPDSPSNATATVSPSTVAQALAPSDAAVPNLDISLGTSVAGGHFGATSQAQIVATALGVRYAVGGLRFSASIPYMSIRTAGTILTGIDSTPILVSGTTTPRRVTRDGIGDLTLGVSYTLPSAPDGLELELSGRAKLPTARNATQLSSGKTDYSLGAQVTKAFGPVAPFVSATYRIFGDSSRFRLKDGFAASVGASITTSGNLVLLASYHYAEPATRLVKDAHELFAGASAAIPNSRFRLTAFATKGLSSGAAAISGGIGLAVNLSRSRV